MAITEKQIREKIVAKISEIAPTAKVFERNVLTNDRAKWAGLFRHNYAGAVHTHGWIVRRSGLTKAVKTRPDQVVYELLGFYGFDYGSASSNSEDAWQTIIDNLAEAFADDGIWDFEAEDEVTTDALSFQPIGLIPAAAGEFLHFAGGRLTVNVYRC